MIHILVMVVMFALTIYVPRLCGIMVAGFFVLAGCTAANNGEPLNALLSFVYGAILGGCLCFLVPSRSKPKEAPRP